MWTFKFLWKTNSEISNFYKRQIRSCLFTVRPQLEKACSHCHLPVCDIELFEYRHVWFRRMSNNSFTSIFLYWQENCNLIQLVYQGWISLRYLPRSLASLIYKVFMLNPVKYCDWKSQFCSHKKDVGPLGRIRKAES